MGAGTLGAYSGSTDSDGTLAVSSILFDGVHFAITDGAPSALVTIDIDLGGTLLGSGSYSNAFSLTFGGALGYSMQNGAFTVTNEQGWLSPSLTNESVTGFHFHGTLSVTDGESVPLLMSLQLGCISGEICDLSHTAALSFGLPSDVTFTSDSGVLLSQTPEPASFALMGAGLVALSVFRKRAIHKRGSDTLSADPMFKPE